MDQITLLTLIKEGEDVISLQQNNPKIEGLLQSLVRKSLITENGKLTIIGEELLDFLKSRIVKTLERKKISTIEFDEWWSIFPASDHFEYKGRIFTGSRTMRIKKEECKLKFNSILNQGIYTARQVIDATKYVVYIKKENSLKKGSNELTYLQNSLTFLGGGHFEAFVNMVVPGDNKEKQLFNNGFDI